MDAVRDWIFSTSMENPLAQNELAPELPIFTFCFNVYRSAIIIALFQIWRLTIKHLLSTSRLNYGMWQLAYLNHFHEPLEVRHFDISWELAIWASLAHSRNGTHASANLRRLQYSVKFDTFTTYQALHQLMSMDVECTLMPAWFITITWR